MISGSVVGTACKSAGRNEGRVAGSLLLLLHILAILMGVVFAGPRDSFLVITMSLPPVLTVLLVEGGALCLCVGLILCLVLLHTHILVDGLALGLVLDLAHLSCGRLAQSLCFSATHLNNNTLLSNILISVYLFISHLLILCCAHLCLCLHILGIPQGDILCPTGNTGGVGVQVG